MLHPGGGFGSSRVSILNRIFYQLLRMQGRRTMDNPTMGIYLIKIHNSNKSII